MLSATDQLILDRMFGETEPTVSELAMRIDEGGEGSGDA
jgi:hypothetical protein